eukprot:TRINITY_DN22523_c0_g1_i1.p3 TRINITY_DN22523_c0_g1~~TRINITY_DN22523_c0_g1_i1.p3  ORF type:complete len:157 (-),score=64.85 TRINITY_DN22523_c0_g1_i1:123-593(-)
MRSEEYTGAATRIQAVVRSRKAKHQVRLERAARMERRHCAAITIQRRVRGMLVRNALSSRRLAEEARLLRLRQLKVGLLDGWPDDFFYPLDSHPVGAAESAPPPPGPDRAMHSVETQYDARDKLLRDVAEVQGAAAAARELELSLRQRVQELVKTP